MDFASLAPLEGGWSGETFVAGVGDSRVVVRIHARHPARAEVDAALLTLVRGLLPVPQVLEVRRATGDLPALLVTELLPGERGDLVVPRLDEAGLATLGAHVGRLAATLAGMPWPRAGAFVDGDLTVRPWDLPDGLAGFVAEAEPELASWDDRELAGLREVADRAQDLLDTVDRTCLVHSDLNPKNLLVDPDTLEVTGLVDWEFAHAGHPCTDLGNALRFEREPAWVDAVLASYGERHGVAAADALELARAADLWALVDLARRPASSPVAARAEARLRAIARNRDLDAE